MSRRMPGSASAPCSIISARPLPCCFSRISACSASPGCGSLRRARLRAAHPALAHLRKPASEGRLLVAFGACLAVMNCSFYLALDRLPISLVAAIEFVGTIVARALWAAQQPQSRRAGGCRRRHLAHPDRRQMVRAIRLGLSSRPSTARCSSATSCLAIASPRAAPATGIASLGAAMAVAFLVVLPVGFSDALRRLFFAGSARSPPSASASALR